MQVRFEPRKASAPCHCITTGQWFLPEQSWSWTFVFIRGYKTRNMPAQQLHFLLKKTSIFNRRSVTISYTTYCTKINREWLSVNSCVPSPHIHSIHCHRYGPEMKSVTAAKKWGRIRAWRERYGKMISWFSWPSETGRLNLASIHRVSSAKSATI